MIDSFEELKTISQEFYCIVYLGIDYAVPRLCYLQRNNKPLFFYSYEKAKAYFDVNEIATQNDSWWFWKVGNLNYPEAKICKVTVSDFEIVEE